MKLMAIIGSPRKGGNTELLVDKVVEGCKSKAAVAVEKIVITDKNIQQCNGCLTCTFPPPGTGKCVLRDDMDELLEQIKASDAFIFGTPNHMRTVTAPMLNFLARMLPLLRYEQQPGVGLAVRKYVLMRRGLLSSAAQRQPAAPLSSAARAEVDHLLQRLARHDPRARI